MITEDYVSFEVAKLLKEKGFNESCYTYYDDIDDSINRFDKGLHFSNTSYPWGVPYDISKAKKYVVAPTLQMAMKWLREEKRTSIIIVFDVTKRGYCPYVYQLDYDMDWVVNWRINTPMKYEEACETALKYCLENLI